MSNNTTNSTTENESNQEWGSTGIFYPSGYTQADKHAEAEEDPEGDRRFSAIIGRKRHAELVMTVELAVSLFAPLVEGGIPQRDIERIGRALKMAFQYGVDVGAHSNFPEKNSADAIRQKRFRNKKQEQGRGLSR
jgi:hypothetical protein